MTGVAVPLDTPIVDRLCKDLDGCEVTIALCHRLFDNCFSRVARIYLATVSGSGWTESEDNPSRDKLFNDNNVQSDEINNLDRCYFGDFDTSTNNNNGRSDSAVGFGFLNATGDTTISGEFISQANRTCRLIIKD